MILFLLYIILLFGALVCINLDQDIDKYDIDGYYIVAIFFPFIILMYLAKITAKRIKEQNGHN